MSAAVSNGKEPPKLCISFPATRFYMRQLVVNPNLAFKNFLHKTMPFAFKDPKETRRDKEALKAKVRKAVKFDRYKFKYKNKKHLATGGFGKIYKASCLLKAGPNGTIREDCALKIIPLRSTGFFTRILGQRFKNAVDDDAAQNELAILKKLQGNKFIMEYKYDTLKNGKLIIVTEFCSGRDLADILERSAMLPAHYFVPGCNETTNRIPCNLVRFILAPMFDALAHMHEHGYIHRDIKPQNILVDKDGVPKLCDFGLAVYMDKKKGYCSGDIHMAGSSYYMAPESVCRMPYTTTLDTWQMGITMLVLAYGWGPYHFMKQRVHWEQRGQDDHEAICFFYRHTYATNNSESKAVDRQIRSYLSIRKKDILESEENTIWSEFKAFVGALMKFSIQQRPSCRNVVQHEYIAEPVAEWKTMKFKKFRQTFEEWQEVIRAC